MFLLMLHNAIRLRNTDCFTSRSRPGSSLVHTCWQLITSVKEVMFSLCLFILFVIRIKQKLPPSIFTKFCGKAAHGPQKKPLDFGGNPDHGLYWTGLILLNGFSFLVFFFYFGSCGRLSWLNSQLSGAR